MRARLRSIRVSENPASRGLPVERLEASHAGILPVPATMASLIILLIAAGIVSGPGCSSRTTGKAAWVPSPSPIVWPKPPDRPRIEYLGALRAGSPEGKASVARRIGRFFAGHRETAMLRPVAISGSQSGRLAIADPGVPTVHLYDLSRSLYFQADDRASRRLQSPVGVAVAENGRVFVADSQQGRVFVLSESGQLLAEWGEGILTRPTGLALDDSNGFLYIVDTPRNEVVCLDQNGRLIDRFGKRGVQPGQFNYPVHLVLTPEGALGLTDALNFRVQVVSKRGEPLLAFGSAGDRPGDFTRPKGIGVDADGRYYVVDSAFECVQIFDRSGRLLLTFGGSGSGPGELSLPAGIYIDHRNRIYVADSYNRRVQVFRLLEES